MAFEYRFLRTNGKDVGPKLNALGAEGWRLHSFEPMYDPVMCGVEYHIVMDRLIADPEPPRHSADPPGIPCRG